MSGQCTCGHGHPAHEHYRRGSDCALCTCAAFRAEAPLAKLSVTGLAQRRARRVSTALVRLLLHQSK